MNDSYFGTRKDPLQSTNQINHPTSCESYLSLKPEYSYGHHSIRLLPQRDCFGLIAQQGELPKAYCSTGDLDIHF